MYFFVFSDHTSNVTMYDLVAVICHHGTAGGKSKTSVFVLSLVEYIYLTFVMIYM